MKIFTRRRTRAVGVEGRLGALEEYMTYMCEQIEHQNEITEKRIAELEKRED